MPARLRSLRMRCLDPSQTTSVSVAFPDRPPIPTSSPPQPCRFTRRVVFVGVESFTTPAGTTVTMNNNASGSGGPTKVGAGTLILGGNNTFTGFTAINGGFLSVAGDNNLGAGTSVTFNGGTLLTTG